MEVWTVWLDTVEGEVPLFKGVFSSIEKAQEWADKQEGAEWGYILAMREVLDAPVNTADPVFPRPKELVVFHKKGGN